MKTINHYFRVKYIIIILTWLFLCISVGCASNVYIPTEEELEVEIMYKNHLTLPVKPLAEVADPFIMRFDGWYYLYSTGVVNIWRSKDLAEWNYMGTVNSVTPIQMGFAPEVYYWNGKFYMYTSPSGKGHYIYVANKPTGPFVQATGNLGMELDGSVFIEDDGTWYFTRASGNGIVGHNMSSPLVIDKTGITLNVYMDGWTEGPMIIKRDGRYFMMYTGTHYKSDAYREKYSVSEEGPFGRYIKPYMNPILINNLPESHALGHSCFVYGPDLDSMYIAYHSYTTYLTGRVMNIDRLSFNGNRMYVNGPTLFEMPVADLPRFAVWTEDDPVSVLEKRETDGMEMLLTQDKTGDTFTAEWNLKGGDGDTGVVFCNNDTGEYYRILWLQGSSLVRVERVSKKENKIIGEFELPKEFKRGVLHSIKVQYSPEQFTVFFDNMNKLTYDNPGPGTGRIGYIYSGTRPEVGFTGFSDTYKGSSDGKSIKPIPSRFDGIHHMPEENKGYGGDVSIGSLTDGVKTVILKKKNAWVSYNVNTEKDALYGIALQVGNNMSEDINVEVLEDGRSLGIFTLKKQDTPSFDLEQNMNKLPLGRVLLKAGIHYLTFRLSKGENLEILSVDIYAAEDDDLPVTYDLTLKDRDMTFRGDKAFYFSEEGMANPNQGDIKMTIGKGSWTDYIINTDVIPGKFAVGNSGVIFRTNNETYFQYQTINAMQGYYAGISKGYVFLKRMNYEDTENVAKVPYSVKTGTVYALRIEAKGNSIKVYVDDMENPLITYFDAYPYLNGRVGIWSYRDTSVYKNYTVTAIE